MELRLTRNFSRS